MGILFADLSSDITQSIIELAGWKMETAGIWNSISGNKVVLHHPLDGIIKEKAWFIKSIAGTDTTIIELKFVSPDEQNPSQLYHCYALDSVEAEWKVIVTEARRALKSSKQE
jgi:hypothetical protein